MKSHSLLEEPGRVDEPEAAEAYADVLSQVATGGRPVIVAGTARISRRLSRSSTWSWSGRSWHVRTWRRTQLRLIGAGA